MFLDVTQGMIVSCKLVDMIELAVNKNNVVTIGCFMNELMNHFHDAATQHDRICFALAARLIPKNLLPPHSFIFSPLLFTLT